MTGFCKIFPLQIAEIVLQLQFCLIDALSPLLTFSGNKYAKTKLIVFENQIALCNKIYRRFQERIAKYRLQDIANQANFRLAVVFQY